MIMNRSGLFLVLLPVLFIACKTTPQEAVPPQIIETPVETAVPVEEPAPAEPEFIEPPANTSAITQEMYDQTLAEVKRFIENLNKSIGSKNYNAWKNALTDERFAEISSPEFLKEQSESPLMKNRKIVLKTPNDYFLNVVVPSRANSKVDEIDFVDENNVKAFYLETRTRRDENNNNVTETRRLRLYELTKTGNEWKITS